MPSDEEMKTAYSSDAKSSVEGVRQSDGSLGEQVGSDRPLTRLAQGDAIGFQDGKAMAPLWTIGGLREDFGALFGH